MNHSTVKHRVEPSCDHKLWFRISFGNNFGRPSSLAMPDDKHGGHIIMVYYGGDIMVVIL